MVTGASSFFSRRAVILLLVVPPKLDRRRAGLPLSPRWTASELAGKEHSDEARRKACGSPRGAKKEKQGIPGGSQPRFS